MLLRRLLSAALLEGGSPVPQRARGISFPKALTYGASSFRVLNMRTILINYVKRLSGKDKPNFVLPKGITLKTLTERQRRAMDQMSIGVFDFRSADIDDLQFTKTMGGQSFVSILVDGVVFEKMIP